MTTNPCTTLTACRVCSAEDRAITYNGGQGGISYIRCACCNFGAFGDTEAEAIAAWNTRLQAGQGEGWRPIETAPKDGTILELVVDYADGDHPLQNARVACTIGFNQFDDNGEDEWKFAGWCWCNDYFTEGEGKVIAWRPSRLNASDDALGPLPAPEGEG